MENAKSFYGNGVGLNIVHRIMDCLQGKLDYENHRDSKGVTFTIQFKKKMLSDYLKQNTRHQHDLLEEKFNSKKIFEKT